MSELLRQLLSTRSDGLVSSDSVMEAAWRQVADTEILELLGRAFDRGPYDPQIVESILAQIESRGLLSAPSLAPHLDEGSPWRGTVNGLWVTARLLELRDDPKGALCAWDAILHARTGDLHEAHLSRARLTARIGRIPEAYANLRSAVSGQPDYDFLARAAKLLARLPREASLPFARGARLAVLSSSTMDLMVPLLRLACFREGIDTEWYVAPYGNYQQEILDPNSGMYAFAPDFVIIATHWRDANLPPFSDHPGVCICEVVDRFVNLWKTLLARRACRIIQHNFDLPATESYGHLSYSLSGGRAHMLRKINLQLAEASLSSVAVLDLDHVSARFGKDAWHDPAYWYLAKQHPAARALPDLVKSEASLIRAGLGLTRKVLVLDLDDTLWGGVIGEDGVEGIRLGPPSPSGEAYQDLQRYALELKDRGTLLAVCSKNNEDDARMPFERHDAMLLRLKDFVAFKANWRDKATNLREISEELSLGLDSFVFLDDNPVERELIRRELPEVAVPEVGADPASFVTALERGSYFQAWTLSKEDRERHESYQANRLRDELRTSTESLEDFLCGLEMEAGVGPFNEQILGRVTQLFGKTNQFNLTTKRYSESQIRQMMASPEYWTQYFKLKDRFGDNGLIGVMIAKRLRNVSNWEIDTWLMSCRVIGRQVEKFMLQRLHGAALAEGVRALVGRYIPTKKNGMVADLFLRFGFTKISETAGGEIVYQADIATLESPSCEFIHLERQHVGAPEGLRTADTHSATGKVSF